MNKALALLATIAAAALLPAPSAAETFTFAPTPVDIYDLDHRYFYTWGFDVSSLSGMNILEAELVIEDITNWDNEANVLYIHLLNGAPAGVQNSWDNEGGGDAFTGQGILLDAWHDTNGTGPTDDLHYTFSGLGFLAQLASFASDGVLGFGFDPDCHFTNAGVRLVITAEAPNATEDASWSAIKIMFKM
jgi:hypothetical protein